MKNNFNNLKKYFTIGDLFVCAKAKGYKSSELIDGDIPYVARAATNNGITNTASNNDKLYKGNVITIHHEWSEKWIAFYQPNDFITDGMIYILQPRFKMNPQIGIFLCTLLNFTYVSGNGSNKDLVPNIKIKLPIDKRGQPDWNFMTEYIKKMPIDVKIDISVSNKPLDVKNWGGFKVSDIFQRKKIKKYSKKPDSNGNIPFITSSAVNNGIVLMSDKISTATPCITISTNGGCFDCFYQPGPCGISVDVEPLFNEKLDEYNSLFICTILAKTQKHKYNYGKKPKGDKIWNTVINLPVRNKQPDWNFMTKYMKHST